MLETFLQAHGWAGVPRAPITPDWSARRYWRLEKTPHARAILLVCPPDDSPDATPGHKLGDLIRINGYLQNFGLNAPHIIASDTAQGFALLEDFGNNPISENVIVPRGTILNPLIQLHKIKPAADIMLPRYEDTHIPKKLQAFAQYVLKTQADDFYALCCHLMTRDARRVFTHVDFRGGNLHKLDNGGIGILDAQGAVWGPIGYDLMTFIEDQREGPDMDEDEKRAYIRTFCTDADIAPDWFEGHYALWRFLWRAGVLGQMEKRNNPAQSALRAYVAERTRRDAKHPALPQELLRFLSDAWHG